MKSSSELARWVVTLALGCFAGWTWAADVIQPVGKGGWRTHVTGQGNPVPEAPFRTPEMMKRAAPTNQWYSSVMFTRWSEVLHAVPLSAKASPRGLEVGYPHKTLVPTERRDIEVIYPHSADLILRPLDFVAEAALLAGHSDWAVDIAFQGKHQTMLTTIAHGSPFVYTKLSHGDLALDVSEEFNGHLWSLDTRVLILQGKNKNFAAFAPTDGKWERREGGWNLRLPQNRKYASVAVLPDLSDETLKVFLSQSYSHIVDTRADFEIDRQTGGVTSRFKVVTQAMEGPQGTGLVGLYPHHWHENKHLPNRYVGKLGSVRGDIKLFAAAEFETRVQSPGFVPYWPGVKDSESVKSIQINLNKEASRARRMMLEIGQGPYWQGKGLQRISQLMAVADAQGEIRIRDELLGLIKNRAESWLSGASDRTYFHYSPRLGTVVAYPEEYDAVKDMNDHHFHYGYWIRAAADIALRDPDWAKSDQWGGMINLLVADIATAQRGRSDFPYLRNFDPYEGHSWASGVAMSPDGNNQESSSEAINAWAGLMIWGAVQGRQDWMDLGTYLYATEIHSVNHYWFDIHRLTLPAEYLNVEVSMLFGGKLAHNTWWIDEPRQIHGINLLPISSSSTYLASSPDFVKANLAALQKETAIYHSRAKRAKPEDIWQDIFAKYLALVDPVQGKAIWDEWGSVELGDTRTHALYWLSHLQSFGPVDLKTTANTPFYAVFGSGVRKAYLVFNASEQIKTVNFSDGKVVEAAPRRLSIF
jgi:endoglucanase Acf2